MIQQLDLTIKEFDELCKAEKDPSKKIIFMAFVSRLWNLRGAYFAERDMEHRQKMEADEFDKHIGSPK